MISMKWLTRCLFMLVLSPTLALAAVVEVQVNGSGLTKESAIEAGLIQALRQVHGMDIKSVQQSKQSQLKVDGKSSTEISVNRNSLLSAKGQIAGYDIVNSQCADSSCRVELNVRIHQYKVPGLPSDKRRSIAVLPFTGGKEFRKMITRHVQEQLVQSRRFAVLDRKQHAAFEAEKSLWQSNDVPIAEKARLGQVLGLDYIVVGSIEKAGVQRWSTSAALTGEKENHVRTSATVRYQIIAVATRQIKWSDTVSVTLSNVGSLEQAAVATGKKISGELLDNIYPLRVFASNSGQVILNQGGKTIQNGSYFTIFSLGEVIIDPYTNEPLGQSETKVATIKVTRVEAKMAYANVVEGDSGTIKPSFIARPGSAAVRPAKKRSSASDNVVVPKAGGVIL